MIATGWTWAGRAAGDDPTARRDAVVRTATAPREAAGAPSGPQGSDVGGPIGSANSGLLLADRGLDRDVWLDRRSLAAEPLTGYVWPLPNGRITNAFGRGQPGSFVVRGRTFHDGIDISSWCGDRIRAAHSGVVLAAGRKHQRFMGWVGDLTPFREKMDRVGWAGQSITVVIDDGNGYRSAYSHLSRATVEIGDVVRAGEVIGYEGSTGNSTGCHLHYALFNPLETRTIALEARAAEVTRLPGAIVARIDPLSVLPPLRVGGITWAWGARGSAE